MKTLPSKRSFYCQKKGIFCRIARCAQKAQECETEREIIRQNQIIEFDDVFLPVGH